MLRFCLSLLFTLLSLQFAHATQISPSEYFEGPQSIALGGTGRAAVVPNESGALNPATLAFIKGYNFGAIYGAESAGPRAGANKYHLVISDSGEESMFAGALSYSKINLFSDGKDTNYQQAQFSFGKDVMSYVSMGVKIKYLRKEVLQEEVKDDFNTGLGFLLAPRENMGFGVMLDDMLSTSEVKMIPTLGFGAFYDYKKIARFRLDSVQPQKENPNRRWIHMVGLESFFLGNDFALRLGHRWDDYRGTRFVSAGLGWQGPRLGLNYAFEQDSETADYRHLVDMLLQF